MVEERAITIVLDIRNMSPQQFDLYRMALERVIYEQVTQIAKFNLIRYVPWNYHIAGMLGFFRRAIRAVCRNMRTHHIRMTALCTCLKVALLLLWP